jgi:hypothetical protein
MKVSYNWLKSYLNFPYSADELSDILTQTGLEVEGLEAINEIQGGLEGVVIGEVLTAPNCLWRTQCGGRSKSNCGYGWLHTLPTTRPTL